MFQKDGAFNADVKTSNGNTVNTVVFISMTCQKEDGVAARLSFQIYRRNMQQLAKDAS